MNSNKEVLLLTVAIKLPEDIVAVRQRTRQIMQMLGFDKIEQTHMATAISEIARNACQYADGGVLQYSVEQSINPSFLVHISDHGKGIAHLSSILSGQYRSPTGLGLGIVGAKKLVDYFHIHSSPRQGTKVSLGMKIPNPKDISKTFLAQIGEELVKNRPKSASEEVQAQNQELMQALDLLSKATADLEKRVDERTQSLKLANENLQSEIEKRKEIENSLREVSARLNLSLQSAYIGTWRWDLKSDKIVLDKALCKIFNLQAESKAFSFEEFTGYILAEDRDRVSQALKNIINGTFEGAIEFRLRWSDGSISYLVGRAKLHLNEGKQPEQVLGVLWDKTQEKKYEEAMHIYREKIIEASKRSSLGEVASSLAHEINHPLAVISAYIRGCINRLNIDYKMTPEIFDILKEAAVEAERVGEVVHRIKNFVQKGHLYYEAVDPILLINEALQLLQHECIQYTCPELVFEPASQLDLIEVDKIQLQQVILNLLRNAMEAMHEAHVLSPKITIKLHVQEKEYIKISIIDNGPGFTKDVKEKIFEAYFTTKLKGTGLGLSICRSIIEAHGGQIVANSVPQQGSIFELTIPYVREL